MDLIYNVEDKPALGQLIAFAVQQLLAIMAATLAVPVIVGHGMSVAAALFGAGVGTLVYLFFTRGKSPVFLGSSFAFLGSMSAAFAGSASMQAGYLGLIVGAFFAGLVYVVIAFIVKKVGVAWIEKLMPAVVIGPTVSIIGLSLASNAVRDLLTGSVKVMVKGESVALAHPLICLLCGLTALFVTMLCSTYGKKSMRLIPFIYGILAGYGISVIFTIVGYCFHIDALKVINFNAFNSLFPNGRIALKSFVSFPDFTFLQIKNGFSQFNVSYLGTIFAAYVPVAFVVFAEHIADHKNISSIINRDLLKEPGLHRTLMGDGVGSMIGAFFGGCPNTTYGESVACVALTRNASVATIKAAAIAAIVISFLNPFVAFVNSIPSCVMGGVCMALYGFIAVSGLKMIQHIDLGDNHNLYVVSVILIAGIGGLTISFGTVTLTEVACALILGIITNKMLGYKHI